MGFPDADVDVETARETTATGASRLRLVMVFVDFGSAFGADRCVRLAVAAACGRSVLR
jgi:hypothetical protein